MGSLHFILSLYSYPFCKIHASLTHAKVYSRVSAQYEWIQSNVCSFSKNPPDWFNCDDAVPAASIAPSQSPQLEEEGSLTIDPSVATSSPSASGVLVPCKMCEGKNILDDVEIPGTNGLTCEFASFSVSTFDASSEECTSFALAELTCCPNPPNDSESEGLVPCAFCEGKEILNDVEIPGMNGLTCEFTSFSASSFDASSGECTGLALVELVCCPDPPGSPLQSGVGAIEPTSRFVVSLSIVTMDDCIIDIHC